MNRFFALCVMVFAFALSACAPQHKTNTLTPEQQQAMIPQPFAMSIGGQSYVVRNFEEFANLMKSKPRAFVTYIRMDQYQAAYHLHLASTFKDIGYALAEEGTIEMSGTLITPSDNTVSKSAKKGKKNAKTTVKFYKQTFVAVNVPDQNSNTPNKVSSGINWGAILGYALPVAVTTGLSIWALSR